MTDEILVEPEIPMKIIDRGNHFVVVFNFKKPVKKKLINAVLEIVHVIEEEIAEEIEGEMRERARKE